MEIDKNQALIRLKAASPSFGEMIKQSPSDIAETDTWYENSDLLLYNFYATYARHVLSVKAENRDLELRSIFSVIEELCLYGDSYTKEATEIGLLEDIQTLLVNENLSIDLFNSYLLPKSQHHWKSINDRWHRPKIS